MTRILTVISGKGGVGKTTTVSNLGAALMEKGKNVIILDANVTTPNLSLHLGIPFYPVTIHDVLKKDYDINSAIYEHSSGLRIVPASLSVGAMEGVDVKKLERVLWNLLGQADIIIVDAAAGLGREAQAAIDVADELLIVTNPDLPSVTDALKTIKIAENKGTRVAGVVVNRYRGKSHEMTINEIEDMLDVPILAIIPEDISVPKSISLKVPVVHYRPKSKSSLQFKKLAGRIIGEKAIKAKKLKWYERFFKWF